MRRLVLFCLFCALAFRFSLVVAQEATGSLIINGEKIDISHVSVNLEPDYFNSGQQALRFFLANKKINTDAYIDTSDGKTHYFTLDVGSDQFLRSMTLADPLLSRGSISGVGIVTLEFSLFDNKDFRGRVFTEGVFQGAGDSIEVDVMFAVQLEEHWDPADSTGAEMAAESTEGSSSQAETELDLQLYEAVVAGDSADVSRYLEQGANASLSFDNRSVLAWAAQNGSVDIVSLLLKNGADVEIKDWLGHTALARAISAGQVEVVKYLLSSGLDLTQQEPTEDSLAVMAVELGNPEIIGQLLNAGVDFDRPTLSEDTAVLTAVRKGGEAMRRIVELMGQTGVNMNPDASYETPLYHATDRNDGEMVEALLAAGADPNYATREGNLPLTVSLQYPEIARLLLTAGADPDKINEWGEPPLMSAISLDAVGTVAILLEFGANTNVENPQGYSAMDISRNGGRDEIVALLEKHAEENAAQMGSVSAAQEVPASTDTSLTLSRITPLADFAMPGTAAAYFSEASVKDVLDHYDNLLLTDGWTKASTITDYKTYATIQYANGAETVSLSVTLNPGLNPPQSMVTVTVHGSEKVSDLARYANATVLYEDGVMGVYVSEDSVADVAAETFSLLERDGWQGNIVVDTDEMRQLSMTRGESELSVQISVAPAQNNQTAIQYQLRLK